MIYEVTTPSRAELQYAIPALVGPQGPQGPQGEPGGGGGNGAVSIIYEANVTPITVPEVTVHHDLVLTYLVGLRISGPTDRSGTLTVRIQSGVTLLDSQAVAFKSDADFTAFLIRPMKVSSGNKISVVMVTGETLVNYRIHILGFNQ